ncbi:hypothetical protein HMPREF0005_05060, partial [Achromobacter xylosoxidans C54]
RGRRRAAGLHLAAVGPHARRPVLSVGLFRAVPAALHGRPAPARRDVDLHQPRHRLLGPAQAPGRAFRDHPPAAAAGHALTARLRRSRARPAPTPGGPRLRHPPATVRAPGSW